MNSRGWPTRRTSASPSRVTAADAVLLSVGDLEGLELTLEVLADQASVTTIAESLAALSAGEAGLPLKQARAEIQPRPSPGE
jgi:hypothetical protein